MAALGRHLQRGMDRSVVGLCSSTRENDFARLAAEERRQALMRQVGRFFYFAPKTMRTGWIAVLRRQKRQHFFQHGGIDPGAGIVIEINNFGFGGHWLNRTLNRATAIPRRGARLLDVAHGDASNGSINCASKSAMAGRSAGCRRSRADKSQNSSESKSSRSHCIPKTQSESRSSWPALKRSTQSERVDQK